MYITDGYKKPNITTIRNRTSSTGEKLTQVSWFSCGFDHLFSNTADFEIGENVFPGWKIEYAAFMGLAERFVVTVFDTGGILAPVKYPIKIRNPFGTPSIAKHWTLSVGHSGKISGVGGVRIEDGIFIAKVDGSICDA